MNDYLLWRNDHTGHHDRNLLSLFRQVQFADFPLVTDENPLWLTYHPDKEASSESDEKPEDENVKKVRGFARVSVRRIIHELNTVTLVFSCARRYMLNEKKVFTPRSSSHGFMVAKDARMIIEIAASDAKYHYIGL